MIGLVDGAFLTIVILLILAAIDISYKKWYLSKYAKNFFNIPYVPFIGSVYLAFNKNILDVFEEWAGKIKSSCYLWIFHAPNFFTMDPKAIRVILTHPKTIEKSFVYRFLKPVVKDALVLAEENIWRKNRKVLVKAFSQKQLDQYQLLFNNLPDRLLESFGETDIKSFNELNESAEKVLLDVFFAGLCKFDQQYSKADMSKYDDFDMYATVKSVYNETLGRFMKPWFYLDSVYFNTPQGKNYIRLHTILDKALYQIFEERQALIDEYKKGFYDKNEVNNMIDVMLDQNYDPEQMIGELKFQAVAASDTSAFTITLLCNILGFHPEIQEKIYKEVCDVLGTQELVEPSHLTELKYTEMAIMETLRLFPPIPIIGRQATEDIEIDGNIIPKNTDILIGLMQLHRCEIYWPEPLKFKPERFTSEEIKKRDPYCYIPFSAGNRNCLGGRYAISVIKTAVAKIIRQYRIKSSLRSIEDIKVKSNVSLFMTDDLKCTFVRRHNI